MAESSIAYMQILADLFSVTVVKTLTLRLIKQIGEVEITHSQYQALRYLLERDPAIQGRDDRPSPGAFEKVACRPTRTHPRVGHGDELAEKGYNAIRSSGDGRREDPPMSALHDVDLYRFNLDEFLLIEAQSEERIEMFDGCIYAMAGASPDHERIVSNLFGRLWTALRGSDCDVFGSNLKYRDPDGGSVCIPDLSVICGELIRDMERPDIVTNPTVVIEVLSPSTAKKDVTLKLATYQRMASLREYVLVSQNIRRIEVLHRGKNLEWASRIAEDRGRSVDIESIGFTFDVDEVYERVASVDRYYEDLDGSTDS